MSALAAVLPRSPRGVTAGAGVAPAGGALSRIPAWWGRADWIADVSLTAATHPDLLRAHHVSLDAVVATARAMAAYADHATGRDCRPTNVRVVAASRFSLSVVQRARRVLRELGFVVELLRGRNIMTRAERLEAWRRGSKDRSLASTFALCSRPRRLRLAGSRPAAKGGPTKGRFARNFRGARPHPVERDHLPGALEVERESHLGRYSLRRRTLRETGLRPGSDVRGMAARVRSRLGWLSGTELGRLVPLLTKYDRAGWTAEDVTLAAGDARKALGWNLPARMDRPAAYLARLLREVDPATTVRPTVERAAYEAHLRAAAAAERAGRRARLLSLAGKCAHGVIAGGAGRPSRGVAPCAACHDSRTMGE